MSLPTAEGSSRGATRAATHVPLLGVLLLAFVGLSWGVNWPLMKISLSAMPVLPFRLLGIIVGAIGILTVTALRGESLRVPRSDRGRLLLCSLLNVVGWQMLIAFGLDHMESGAASLLAFTMPFWVVVFGCLVLGERITALQILGLVLGMTGVVVLLFPSRAELLAHPYGPVLIMGAAVTWALGVLAIKRHQWAMTSFGIAGWQLLIATFVVGIPCLLFSDMSGWASDWSTVQLLSVVYCVTVPMIAGHLAFFHSVRLLPPVLSSMGTLLVPVVGVLSGHLLLGEALGVNTILAIVLLVGGLGLVLLLPQITAGSRRPPAGPGAAR